MATPTQFFLSYNIEAQFTVDELWPDGDAPEHPTVEDVHRLIEECGGLERVIDEWDLIERGATFDITEWPPAHLRDRFAARAAAAAPSPASSETKRGPEVE